MTLRRYWAYQSELDKDPEPGQVQVMKADDVRAVLNEQTMMIEQLQAGYCYTVCDGTHTDVCKAAQWILVRVQEVVR